MGADLIGWRNCDLQQSLGPRGFLQKTKMKAYLAAIESQVPPERRAVTKVTVVVNDTERELTYNEIRDAAEQFQAGIPACATCPLSPGGKPIGCYRFITYPVDERFEEVAFELFTSQLSTKGSISDQLYQDIVSKMPTNTPWHTRRGQQRGLAKRAQPLTYKWGGLFSKKTVDSAQLMASLFIPLKSAAIVVGYAKFWAELVAYANQKLEAEMKARGVNLKPDGKIELHVTEHEADPRNLAAKLGTDAAALSSLLEGTFGEIRELAQMMIALAPQSLEAGWSVVVDS
jgi:hypothetical protein